MKAYPNISMMVSMLSAPLRETLAKFRSSAGDGTRTRTPDYRAADFKSAASAIPPLRLSEQSTKSRPSWQCLAACFALDLATCGYLCAGLPSTVRSRSGPRMAPLVEFVAWRVPSASLGTRASPSAIPSLRSALTSFGGYPVPRGGAPASFARHPRRDAVSPGYRLLASLAPVGAIREPHPRVSLRSALGHSPRFLITC